jgi:hypothetical protein
MARQYFTTGTAAPAITPTYAGEIFVDTTADKIYFATGTTSSSDWDPLPINLSDLTIDSDLALGGLYKIKKALGMDFQPASELTIATGAVTQTQSYHTVDTEADAASDSLDTITIATDMSVLLLTLENAARIVTLKHGTGNLNLPDDADIVMAENTVYFLLYNGTAWNLVGSSGSGSGDVVGPASSTDNAIARFDLATGKLIQNSGILIDDSDNMSGVGTLDTTGDITVAGATTETKDINIGTGRSGNGISELNLVADTTYSVFGLRVRRNGNGANSDSDVRHRGTGALRLISQESGSIELKTSDTTRMSIASSGEMLLVEMAAPSTPASGTLSIYADSTTSLPMAKNDAGDEIQMGGGVYKTISFNAGGMTPRTTNGAASGTKEYTTNDIDLDFFDFDAATNEGVQIAFMMPDDWDLGTVKFKFIWTTASVAGTGNVQWAVRAVAIPNDSTLDATLGTAQAITDGFLLADDNHTTAATPLVTIGGSPTLGDLVVFEFYRNAAGGADTYTQDARLLNVTMQYKTLDTVTAAW